MDKPLINQSYRYRDEVVRVTRVTWKFIHAIVNHGSYECGIRQYADKADFTENAVLITED